MHNYKRLPMSFLGSKALKAAALSTLLVFSNAYATGLGKLTVLSSLGQPLRAEIELTSPNKEEINSLVPRLASIEAFRQANIEFNPALLSLQFAIEQRGSGYIIRVTSNQPMNEPWVDFLLEMNASSGRLVREYTFLLDPSEYSANQAAQVVNPPANAGQIKAAPVTTQAPPVNQTVPAPVQAPVKKTPLVEKPAPVKTAPIKSSAEPVHAPAVGDRQYQVKSGDTLRKIASMNLGGVSLDEMLVSIYRANPHAFVGENMNRLKAGQILKIPDPESIRVNPIPDAKAIVLAHSADFNAYRNKLAGRVAEAMPAKQMDKKQASSGQITTKVKETPTASSEALDKLKLSKLSGKDVKANPVSGISEEERIAKDKALADANARVKELEKNVSELNKLLAVPTRNTAAKPPVVEAPKPAEVKPVAPPPAAATPVAPSKPALTHDKAASQASIPASASASAAASATASASEVASASASSASASVKARRVAPPPPPVVEEPGFFDSTYLYAAGLLLLLGSALGFYASRKKKAAHQFEDSILTGSSLKANSMFGSTGGQSVDTNNSVFNSNFAPSASQLDANEVDPVAEADVYIAYGRDSQAEEILKEALRTQPDRHAVRLKLLEIYFGRKDARAFEVYAGDLYGMTRGEGDEWSQAASMGVALDPNNPLYAGASAKFDSYQSAGLIQPTQPLEDLDQELALENSLSPDMLDSISIIDTASAEADEAQTQEKEAAPAPAAVPANDDVLDLNGLDFDLGISDEPVEEFPLTLPELDKPSVQKAVEEEVVPSIDFGSIDFDLGGDDSPSKPAEPVIREVTIDTPSAAKSEESFSLDGLDFVLEDPASDAPEVAPAPVMADEDDALSSDDALGQLLLSPEPEPNGDVPYNAEMATKLDLAVAYQEIGDKEGARELLEEVLKGGSAEQVAKAKDMLAQLS